MLVWLFDLQVCFHDLTLEPFLMALSLFITWQISIALLFPFSYWCKLCPILTFAQTLDNQHLLKRHRTNVKNCLHKLEVGDSLHRHYFVDWNNIWEQRKQHVNKQGQLLHNTQKHCASIEDIQTFILSFSSPLEFHSTVPAPSTTNSKHWWEWTGYKSMHCPKTALVTSLLLRYFLHLLSYYW